MVIATHWKDEVSTGVEQTAIGRYEAERMVYLDNRSPSAHSKCLLQGSGKLWS